MSHPQRCTETRLVLTSRSGCYDVTITPPPVTISLKHRTRVKDIVAGPIFGHCLLSPYQQATNSSPCNSAKVNWRVCSQCLSVVGVQRL